MNEHLLHPRRRLNLEGADNVRDLGGYPTRDGRSTRWGRFFRADGLHALTRQSQDKLIDQGVRVVVDLRLTRELDRQPNVFAERPEVEYHHENVLGDDFQETESPDLGEPADRLLDIYTMVLDRRQPAIRRALGLLADTEGPGVLYNCTAGKDRTGIVSALLLGLAGASRETIVQDYALSARFLVDRYLKMVETGELTSRRDPGEITLQTYRDDFCPPDAMVRALRHLDDRYGGVEQYVTAVGVTPSEITAIRSSLVE